MGTWADASEKRAIERTAEEEEEKDVKKELDFLSLHYKGKEIKWPNLKLVDRPLHTVVDTTGLMEGFPRSRVRPTVEMRR